MMTAYDLPELLWRGPTTPPPGEPQTPATTGRDGGRRCCVPAPRLLVVPGLHGSGPGHWQSWLERRTRGSRRVGQPDWSQAQLGAWSARVAEVIDGEPPGPWIAVAHSFGCLALLHHLLQREGRTHPAEVVAALLVAPADPQRFGAGAQLARRMPLREITVLASSNDPWLPTEAARRWAQTWGTRLVDLGDAGHVNFESGHGPWPFVREQVERLGQRWHAQRRAAAQACPDEVAAAR